MRTEDKLALIRIAIHERMDDLGGSQSQYDAMVNIFGKMINTYGQLI